MEKAQIVQEILIVLTCVDLPKEIEEKLSAVAVGARVGLAYRPGPVVGRVRI